MIPLNMPARQMAELRRQLADEASDIIDRSGASLSPEDDKRFREIDADLDELNRREADRAERLEMVRSNAGVPGRTERADGPTYAPSFVRSRNAWDYNDTMDEIERARHAVDALFRSKELGLPDYAAERITNLLDAPREKKLTSAWVVATGDVAYRSAFARLLGDPHRGHLLWSPEELSAYQRVHAVREQMARGGEISRTAMSTAADHGAELIPLTLDPSIMLTNSGSINPLRRLARVVQTSTNAWQGVTSAGATSEWKTQASQAADGSPDVADTSIAVFFGDVNVTYSYEVGMDAIDLLGELQRIMLDSADLLQATAFTTGNGTTAPAGIVTGLAGTSSEINTLGSETYAATDPFALQNALPARFSGNASWMSHIATMNVYRQFETTNGALQFPELRQNPPMLLSKPYYENSDMDGAINAAATANNYVLLYGDIRAGFTIADRIGSALKILDAFGAQGRPTGQYHAFLYFRTGSKVLVPEAMRLLDVPTTA